MPWPPARGVRARKIGRHPGHPARAKRFDPHLLERLEDHPGDLAARAETLMQLRVMMAQLERDAVGLAANPRQIRGRHVAPGQRQSDPRRRLSDPGLALGLAGPERHRQRRAVCHRPAGRGDRALEGLDPLPARRPHRCVPSQIKVTLAVLSGSSTPKQRW
jgi:hypothetical protein